MSEATILLLVTAFVTPLFPTVVAPNTSLLKVQENALIEAQKRFFLVLATEGTLVCLHPPDDLLKNVLIDTNDVFFIEKQRFVRRPGLKDFITALCGPNGIFYCILYGDDSPEHVIAIWQDINSICPGMIHEYAYGVHLENRDDEFNRSKNLKLVMSRRNSYLAVIVDNRRDKFYRLHPRQHRQGIQIETWTNYVLYEKMEPIGVIPDWRDTFLTKLAEDLKAVFEPPANVRNQTIGSLFRKSQVTTPISKLLSDERFKYMCTAHPTFFDPRLIPNEGESSTANNRTTR